MRDSSADKNRRAGAAPGPPTRKHANRRVGMLGEDAAVAALQKAGYRILDRNWVSPRGRHEIDIIAEDSGIVAFVEVKTRSPRSLEEPIQAVDEIKQGHVRAGARQYLSRFRQPSPTRYDIVSVWVDGTDRVIRTEIHKGAFE